MIGIGLRAWGFSLVALLAACAGLAAVSASASSTSTVRLSIAAAVLSVFAALVALLITPRDERTRLRSLLWGGLVPLVVGIGRDCWPVGRRVRPGSAGPAALARRRTRRGSAGSGAAVGPAAAAAAAGAADRFSY